jgi:hypothetical protein
MSVTLLRPYGGFAANAVVRFTDDTEQALIAQGLATAIGASDTIVPQSLTGLQLVTEGGNVAWANAQGQGTPSVPQGPTILPNMPLGTAALTAAGASSVHVAGTLNVSEIYVPHWNTWKGLAVLNGTVVGTDNMLVALYNSSGALVANSAVAGTLSAGASSFQNRDFLVPVTLVPGRYFCVVQSNGTTATSNKFVAANGVNVMTTSIAGVFGTLPATITVPTTFTTAVGCVCQLYTV